MGMLDAARQTYLNCIAEINSLFECYVKEWKIDGTRLQTKPGRGYYITIPTKGRSVDSLPADISVVTKSRTGAFYECSSSRLTSLSSRAYEALDDCYILTHQEIQSLLVEHLRPNVLPLTNAIDSVA